MHLVVFHIGLPVSYMQTGEVQDVALLNWAGRIKYPKVNWQP